ncbi:MULTISPECIES: hypothetical protein [Kitasatospora]|uniref:Uncharacterized protein n=1 Tax=Kitasatospora setae (strain ATCC 33774 / DSM 43861 / JCM 3304 / KCC A-0304 / NBRC 14216 / KM-6054) TaxID=452652 RepID=E4N649_KITSK|nr:MULTISPECIES: hypothetical protein [Kitasatospora]BAJ26680.1 hypothetical protein KSE_08410 [Kitasatospora setae KM-6054]
MSPGAGRETSPDAGRDGWLPVMARAAAEDWARRLAAYLADRAAVPLAGERTRAFFSPGGGPPADGRYALALHAEGSVPPPRHPAAVRALRAALERDGFTVTAYRETVGGEPDALLYARHPEGGYFLDVGTGGGGDRLTFTVRTPVLLPPP